MLYGSNRLLRMPSARRKSIALSNPSLASAMASGSFAAEATWVASASSSHSVRNGSRPADSNTTRSTTTRSTSPNPVRAISVRIESMCLERRNCSELSSALYVRAENISSAPIDWPARLSRVKLSTARRRDSVANMTSGSLYAPRAADTVSIRPTQAFLSSGLAAGSFIIRWAAA